MAVKGKVWKSKSTGKFAISFDEKRPANDQFIYDDQTAAETERDARFKKSTDIERTTQGGGGTVLPNGPGMMSNLSSGLTR